MDDGQDTNGLEVALDCDLVLVVEVLEDARLSADSTLNLEGLGEVDAFGPRIQERVDTLYVEARGLVRALIHHRVQVVVVD